MKALVLGGNSPHHKQWVRDVKQALEPYFEEVRLHDYRHWLTNSPNIDMDYEINQVAKLAADLGEYVVVAKSIGTAITILGNTQGIISPKATLLMGLPLRGYMSGRLEVAEGLAKLPKTIFLQNSGDPLGSAKDVTSYIEAHPPAAWAIEIADNNTHDYIDFDTIAKLADKLRASFYE